MARHLSRAVAMASLLGALGLAPRTASAMPVPNTIFPSSGTGGSFVIVVVSDGYTNQVQFDLDAKFIFVTRLMVTDPFFSAHASSFTIKTVFDAAPTRGASLYGISTANRSSCDLSRDPATTAKAINDAALVADPNPQYVSLLANDTVSYGCTTRDHWTYVTSGAADRRGIMAHELGHLIGGLFDEYEIGSAPYTGPDVDRSNCSTKLPPQVPHWATLVLPAGVASPPNPAGCLYAVSKIERPYFTCKMRDYDQDQNFCFVCRHEMEALLSPPSRDVVPTAPTNLRIIKAGFFLQPPAIANSSVRLLIRVNRGTGQATVLSANEVQSPQIVQRRIGDYVWAVTENGQTLVTGVIAGDPFQSRMYSGKQPHTSPPSPPGGDAATFVVIVPQASVRSLITRSVQINFYHIETSDPDPVTNDKLTTLLQTGAARPVSVLTPAVLIDRLKALYP